MSSQQICVVGGGIVGLASAWKLARQFPCSRVVVLEKESAPGRHQTTHNSGVLHCGLYYKPGSAKARLAVSGIQQMVAFCQEHQVPHEICGKLVVAATEAELPRLKALFERGQQNGLQGLQILSRDQMREIEPHVGGTAGLRVPQEGIADYGAVCDALVREIENCGGQLATNARLTAVRWETPGWRLVTTAGDFSADFFVNCAGLHCDRVAQLAGEKRKVRIVPFRGEYYKLRPERQHLVRHLIYPVPDPQFPFLGVHFTRLIHGGIEAGPNAVLAFSREGYRKSDVSVRDLLDAFAFPGLWRFLLKHRRMSWQELLRSFSQKRFCASLRGLVPELREADLVTGGTGVRAQAMAPDGTLVQDFLFVNQSRALHLLNAPSPAATAALAIGEEVVRQVAAQLQ